MQTLIGLKKHKAVKQNTSLSKAITPQVNENDISHQHKHREEEANQNNRIANIVITARLLHEKLSQEERDERMQEVARERDEFEQANLGKFPMINASEDEEK